MQAQAVKAGRLTVAALAQAKKVPERWLREELGVHDLEAGGVGIPYRDVSGEVLAVKRRLGLTPDSYRWPAGLPLEAYGLDRLAQARRTGDLVLVEGETDCWALWLAGCAALGLPGACSARQALHGEALELVGTVLIHQEPGKGGEAFLRGCLSQLSRHRFGGAVRLLTMPKGVKDPAELRARAPGDFPQALGARLACAIDLPAEWWLGLGGFRAQLVEALEKGPPAFREKVLGALAPLVGEICRELLGKDGPP